MPLGEVERLLAQHRIMAIATVRPDGWPQNTIVGFAAQGLVVYFMVFRDSQKFANIAREPRVALAIGAEPRGLADIKAAYAGALAHEVIDPAERRSAWGLLERAHPNLSAYAPDFAAAAILRADLVHLSLVDYARGPGHREAFTIAPPQPASSESGTSTMVEPGAIAASSSARS